MRRLRHEIYESNGHTKDQILEVVEQVISDVLKNLDHQSSMLSEKYEGDNELSHYYMGKGMSLRDAARELGVDVDFDPLTNDDLYKDIDA